MISLSPALTSGEEHLFGLTDLLILVMLITGHFLRLEISKMLHLLKYGRVRNTRNYVMLI